MGQDTDLERWELTTAIIGLRGAYKRGMEAYDRGLIPNQQIAGASVAEFVFWACALDERLGKPDPMAHAKRRNADEHGQVLLGLRYVRDRHAHQVAITNSLAFAFEESSLRVWNRWRLLDAIPGPPVAIRETAICRPNVPPTRNTWKAGGLPWRCATRSTSSPARSQLRSSGIEHIFAIVDGACLGKA